MLETQDEKETLNSEQQSPQSTAIFLHASRLCVRLFHELQIWRLETQLKVLKAEVKPEEEAPVTNVQLTTS
jgi:hypothetical protein